MKRLIAVIGTVSLLLLPSLTLAQADEADYLHFNYLKVEPADVEAFKNHVRSSLIPMHQKRVDNGDIDSWSMFQVKYPGGAKAEYNFVSITSAASLDRFEKTKANDVFSGMAESKKLRSLTRKTDQLRTVMYSEAWKVINKIAVNEEAPHAGKYLMIDFMNVAPGKDFDYQMLEDELAKPIHEERVDTDRMQGWEVYSLITPGGTGYGYNFATGNFFNHLENIEFGFTEEVIESAMPGTDIPELFETMFSTRSLVRSEVWEEVARTE